MGGVRKLVDLVTLFQQCLKAQGQVLVIFLMNKQVKRLIYNAGYKKLNISKAISS